MGMAHMKSPRSMWSPAVILSAVLLCGCAGFCRDTYNGVRARNEALRHPAGDNRPAMPDYDTYQRERDKLKKDQAPEE
jgi:hypothetical protein